MKKIVTNMQSRGDNLITGTDSNAFGGLCVTHPLPLLGKSRTVPYFLSSTNYRDKIKDATVVVPKTPLLWWKKQKTHPSPSKLIDEIKLKKEIWELNLIKLASNSETWSPT